jgi:hypothetical protein
MAGRPKAQVNSLDEVMNDILTALDLIKSKLPNGELKVIHDKIEGIESSQAGMQDDLRSIKKQLLDPEDGIVVRVNRNTEYRKKKEVEERTLGKFIDEHKELMSWKETVTKILWILFSSIAGIVVTMLVSKVK